MARQVSQDLSELSELNVTSELETLRTRVQELEEANKRLMGLDPDLWEDFMRKLQQIQMERDEQESKVQEVQKLIMENELESYLSKGWQYVSSLNNGSGKCVVEKVKT